MRKSIIVLLLSSLLVGCSLFKKRVEQPILVPEEVRLSPESLKECAPLVQLVVREDDPSPFVTLLEVHKENTLLYADCSSRQYNSIKLLKKFSNTKEVDERK